MKRCTILILSVLALSHFMVGQRFAMAAQDTTITKDNSPVRAEPQENGKVIDYLQSGDDVRISSYPVNKYYFKVRARNGQYGWIHQRFTTVKVVHDVGDGLEDGDVVPEKDPIFVITGFGGYNLFRPSDLNAVFNFSDLNSGFSAGGELGIQLGKRVSLLLRQEILLKDVVAKEAVTGVVYNLALRSYPLMAGMEFRFIASGPYRLALSAYAGAGLSTSFASEAVGVPSPNVVVIKSTPFTSLIRLSFGRKLGRWLSAQIGAGYRLLRTTPLETVNGINGGGIYQAGGSYEKRSIDLSGPTFDLGLSVHL